MTQGRSIKLSGRVAIVTGASSGIGEAVAERLAADGFAVAINHRGAADRAVALAAAISDRGGRALAVQADVVDPGAVRRLFEIVERDLGGVDVLVNNAGVIAMTAIADTDDATFNLQVDVNFRGVFNMLREGAGRVRAGGRIINISSSVTRLLQPQFGVYTATKAAVEAMTMVMARELRGREITVNAVAPGATATKLFFKGRSPEQVNARAMAAPLERLGEPHDIASAVAFLAGPDGGWVNGQIIHVNGGMI